MPFTNHQSLLKFKSNSIKLEKSDKTNTYKIYNKNTECKPPDTGINESRQILSKRSISIECTINKIFVPLKNCILGGDSICSSNIKQSNNGLKGFNLRLSNNFKCRRKLNIIKMKGYVNSRFGYSIKPAQNNIRRMYSSKSICQNGLLRKIELIRPLNPKIGTLIVTERNMKHKFEAKNT